MVTDFGSPACPPLCAWTRTHTHADFDYALLNIVHTTYIRSEECSHHDSRCSVDGSSDTHACTVYDNVHMGLLLSSTTTSNERRTRQSVACKYNAITVSFVTGSPDRAVSCLWTMARQVHNVDGGLGDAEVGGERNQESGSSVDG